MNLRVLILATTAAILLVGTVAMAQSGGPADPPTDCRSQGIARSRLAQGIASGGNYRLTSVSWYASGTASGGGYRLLSPSSPTLRGSGCCCTYLPCLLRNRQ